MKALLQSWGSTPKTWELVWGDFFQIEVADPSEALQKCFSIKALINSIDAKNQGRKSSLIDVRMAIGIGDKTYTGKRISESSGPAFTYSGERFETLKKERTTLALLSPWDDFNTEMNLYLRLSTLYMDKWSISSAEMVAIYLKNPELTQAELGEELGIKQSSVSGRWNRANIEELMAVNEMYKTKLKAIQQR